MIMIFFLFQFKILNIEFFSLIILDQVDMKIYYKIL
jgi:hypothetical protein